MIYLWTGENGAGKTASAVKWVKEWAEREKRQVFYNAGDESDPDAGGLIITDPQALPWTPIEPLKWYEAPAGSIVFIDEAQQYFRPRQRGVVPEFAERLEVHRRLGLDLVWTCPYPAHLDSHDRKLVHKHFHLMRKFGTRWVTRHEFKGCRDNVDKNRTGSVPVEATIPKDAFKWYRSAQAHTGKVSVPWKVWVLVAILVGLPIVMWKWWGSVKTRISGQEVAAQQVAPGAVQSGVGAGGTGAAAASKHVLTRAEYVAQFVPRVEGLAYTAPAYDEVTKPTEAPYPAACISSATRCQCYTQQGTKLQTTEQLCRDIASGGFFVAWVQPGNAARQPQAVTQVVGEAEHASLGTLGTSAVGFRDPRTTSSSAAAR
jgi:zona occludens toxin